LPDRLFLNGGRILQVRKRWGSSKGLHLLADDFWLSYKITRSDDIVIWSSAIGTQVLVTALTVCGLAVIVACGLGKVDPLEGVLPWPGVVASVGIVAVKGFASLAVLGFFWKDRRNVSFWQIALAPAMAAMGLFLCLWQIIVHVDLLSSSKSICPSWCVGGTRGRCCGILRAVWLTSAHPSLYNKLGRLLNDV
jgi:hypothetical protein